MDWCEKGPFFLETLLCQSVSDARQRPRFKEVKSPTPTAHPHPVVYLQSQRSFEEEAISVRNVERKKKAVGKKVCRPGVDSLQ